MSAGRPRPTSSGSGPSGAAERDQVLAATTGQVLHDLGASAVSVFLRVRRRPVLRAAVVSVASSGIGAAEWVPLHDTVYPSAKAYASNQIATAHSDDIVWSHPGFAASTSAPFSVAAAPLTWLGRRLGTLSVFWLSEEDVADTADLRLLAAAADSLAKDLDRLAPPGSNLLEPPSVPLVLPAARPGGEYQPSAPLIYHLSRLAAQLASAASTKEAVELAVARMVHGFLARAAVVTLADAGRLRVAGASGCTRDFLRSLDGLPLNRPTPETEAMARLRPSMHPAEDPRTSGRCASRRSRRCTWLVLPLKTAEGRPVGAFSVAYGPEQDPARHRRPLTSLAMLLGEACGRTLLHDTQSALAHNLQQTLLPHPLAQPAGLVTSSRYRPAVTGIDLGGDWYDVIDQPSGQVTLVIGDVQGHNTQAAVVMGQLRSATRAFAGEGHGPDAILARTNALLNGLRTNLFATCCCVCLFPRTGRALIATAGHAPPLIRGPGGVYPDAAPETGVPLGIEKDPHYSVREVRLEEGTVIGLYTDGLVGPFAELTPESLEAATAPPDGELESLADHLFTEARTPRARPDDAALLLVRYEGPRVRAGVDVRGVEICRKDVRGAGRVRHLVRDWMEDWRLAAVADDVQLLVSEVVTNAIVHCDSDVSVHVRRYPRRVRVEVRDGDPRPAHTVATPRAEDQEEGGRGLLIVSAIASAWGNSPSGRGKTVWFELPVDPDGAVCAGP